jgi:AcrR family transcriptional regulator
MQEMSCISSIACVASHTRERIMDVALQLFAEKGVAGTPVTAIEAGAGLSPGSGSFYRHFKDKEELLSAVVDRELVRIKKDPNAQVSAAPRDRPPAEALAIQLHADLDWLQELLPMMAILMWERGRALNLARRVQETMVERGVELGIADLLFRAPVAAVKEDPAAAATVMMSAVVGYFLTAEYFNAASDQLGANTATEDPRDMA